MSKVHRAAEGTRRKRQGVGADRYAVLLVFLHLGNLLTLSRLVGVTWLVLDPPQWDSAWLAAAAFIYFYWITDFLDGAAARWTNTASRFGESLDLYIDRLCDLIIATALISADAASAPLAVLFLLVRFPADIVVGRLYGGDQGVYGRAAEGLFNDPRLVRRWRRVVLEAAHICRTVFFADVLFQLALPFSSVLFALFLAGYATFVTLLLYNHAREDG